MNAFLKLLKTKGIIQRLKRNYDNNQNYLQKGKSINELIEFLSKLEDIDKNYVEQNEKDINAIDIIGDYFQKRISKAQRKKFGQFFTPISIVKNILDNIGYSSIKDLENKKIIDLSCGCGSFLIQAVKSLIDFYVKKFNIDKISQLSVNEAKIIIKAIKKNIYGIDINPLACVLCCINLYFSFYKLIELIIKEDTNYIIPDLKIYRKSALDFSDFNEFDFVVGNPPYIFVRNIKKNERISIKKGNFHTTKGQFDYYQIFIEIGIKALKPNGLLGYILPDSILVLSNRKSIRKFIFANTKIREINYIGNSFEEPVVSNVIILLQKEPNIKKKLENRISINKGLINNSFKVLIPQKVLKSWDYKFLVNLNEEDFKILNHLNDKFPKLKNIMSRAEFKIIIFRGVELGKEGIIIYCKTCKKYIPAPRSKKVCKYCGSNLDFQLIEKIINDKPPNKIKENYKRFIFSMNRYKIKEYKYINITKKGINYKNLEDYSNRIVIRQLSQNNMICATFSENALTSQSIYNLKILKSPIAVFNHFYLLGLINSQLLSYYFIKIFGSYKKLFPRILIEKIKNLPIKIPRTPTEQSFAHKIQERVKKILDLDHLNDKEIKRLQNEIDESIFKLYQISPEKREYISTFLN